MQESTQRVLDMIKRARPKFTNEDLLDIYEDLTDLSANEFVEAMQPPKKPIKLGSPDDPNFIAFMEARNKLSMVKTSEYVTMLLKALDKRGLLGSYQLNASQTSSVAKFYEGLTRRLNPETIVSVALDMAAGRI
ncbi:hypothetical protein [Hirschia baltica]|uniref:Uncharacterized protein n=1 Tax=Hirschia baltica (strain ATCC 49814 / DSM 5838 / IFAM 1418) TaxID=582402 RepID=C6XI35_HIRBI|nr:hypothetical protein [Hirschia baltica]ACT58861.1 hypothetical protein Hbal_1169 [Hirschia baltica ATCC 49814]